jgi:hypothetical protein
MANPSVQSQAMPLDAPRVALLGVCERAAFVRKGHHLLWCHNLIGLRHTLVNYFYPCGASGWHIVFAYYDPFTFPGGRLRLIDDTSKELFSINFSWEQATGELQGGAFEQREWRLAGSGQQWQLVHFPLEALVIQKPGIIRVYLQTDTSDEEICVGQLYCIEATPQPLTEDRIAAIRSDPQAAKYVRVVLGCKKCPAKLYVQAGIDRPKDIDGKEKVWYEDAPEEWTCNCGLSRIDLKSVRKNLHGILGTRTKSGDQESELTFIRMYEKGTLADVCAEFGALLDNNPGEQEVQHFLEKHTVFLHRFSPVKIKRKAPILTKYQTDFAILDSRGMLLLVELEKSKTKLLKQDGGIAQELQHAFDQVREWHDEVQRHWVATMDCMGFRQEEVAGVRGVVIAGRDQGYSSSHLMRLKGADYGQVEFYTYDDLLEDTVNLARHME